MDKCSQCHGSYQYGMESEDCLFSNGLCPVCDWLVRKAESGGISPNLAKTSEEEE
jgi:hypothetical protein